MTREGFLTHLDELLGLPEGTLKGDEKLEELEGWNSLAVVGFIALADEDCDTRISPKRLAACATVNDLTGLVGFQN